MHCYYTTGFLITLRRTASPGLEALRQASSVQPQLGSDPIRALHPLISSLYTQFSALALKLNERLDALEQRVLHEANDQELAEITAIRSRAAVTRRIVTPGRDLAARTPLIQSLPGATSETQLYAEDINDELQQVVADLTAIEERCAALLVLHASLASKHLGVVSTTFYEPLPASTARVRILSVANLSPVRLARTSPAATGSSSRGSGMRLTRPPSSQRLPSTDRCRNYCCAATAEAACLIRETTADGCDT